MATERILHPEWRDEGEPTKYPFADHVTLMASSGAFIPEDLFLDAIFYPIGSGARLYLSKVSLTHQEAVLTLSDENATAVAYGTLDILNPADTIRFVDLYGRPAGLIVSEAARLSLFQAWQAGDHVFQLEDSEFVAACCIPTPEIGVRGIILEDGTVFTDDIWIIGEQGVVLTPSEEVINRPGMLDGDLTVQVIRVDIVGDPLFRRALCVDVFETPRLLEQITVQDGCKTVVAHPDAQGDFKITVGHQNAVDTILRIRATPDGLVIETVGEQLKSVK